MAIGGREAGKTGVSSLESNYYSKVIGSGDFLYQSRGKLWVLLLVTRNVVSGYQELQVALVGHGEEGL